MNLKSHFCFLVIIFARSSVHDSQFELFLLKYFLFSSYSATVNQFSGDIELEVKYIILNGVKSIIAR